MATHISFPTHKPPPRKPARAKKKALRRKSPPPLYHPVDCPGCRRAFLIGVGFKGFLAPCRHCGGELRIDRNRQVQMITVNCQICGIEFLSMSLTARIRGGPFTCDPCWERRHEPRWLH